MNNNEKPLAMRKATLADLDEILKIYAAARGYMADQGNFSQWKNSYPPRETVEEDISLSRLYLLDDGAIQAVFMFMKDREPTYAEIDGAWKNDLPYGTIHRVASAGARHGIMGEIVCRCYSQIPNLRIDTHENNKAMRCALEKNGFSLCGKITLADGSPRLAFQKI